MSEHHHFIISPWRAIILSLLVAMVLGAILLALPFAQRIPIAYIDALFTSASAVSVTGILTIPLNSFTLAGKTIILLLIQIGALGLLTLITPLMALFFQVRMKTHIIAGHQFEIENWKSNWIYHRSVIKFIVLFSLAVEAVGALATYLVIGGEPLTVPRWFAALFHGISAYCNSGIAIFPGDMAAVQHNHLLILISTLLMIVGSFGFVPLYEISQRIKRWHRGQPQPSHHLTLHSKIIVCFTPAISLIFVPLIWLSEHQQFVNLSFWETLNLTVFNAISLRSCGFCTMDVGIFANTTLLLVLIFAFIGSSPGSVAGGTGIKVTSFVLSLATMRAAVMNAGYVELFGRRIPQEQVLRAFAIITLSLSWCLLSTLTLMVTERGSSHAFVQYLFEAVSAFANHGVSIGLAQKLSIAGKLVFSSGMIFGRISSLTLILAIKKRKEKPTFQYPEEGILLV
ncbi:MAG: hypothetical protein M1549_02320 [Candidatus Dependentiae bacterium]|nr:hypothetical protein [Candidatus Dependentiae bacterium]